MAPSPVDFVPKNRDPSKPQGFNIGFVWVHIIDLQSLFRLHVHSRTLKPRKPPPPLRRPAFGLIYEGAIGQLR